MIAIPDPLLVLMDDEPLLRTQSAPVLPEHFGFELDRLLNVMVHVAMARRYPALGLAAVQIGVPVRALIVQVEPGSYRPFINPELTRSLNRFAVDREGCLSVPPSKWGNVSRPAKCDVTWSTPQGEQISETLRGDVARIFQHELDHLNGILMTDRRAAA
jgi:peptide deformylase